MKFQLQLKLVESIDVSNSNNHDPEVLYLFAVQ